MCQAAKERAEQMEVATDVVRIRDNEDDVMMVAEDAINPSVYIPNAKGKHSAPQNNIGRGAGIITLFFILTAVVSIHIPMFSFNRWYDYSHTHVLLFRLLIPTISPWQIHSLRLSKDQYEQKKAKILTPQLNEAVLFYFI